MLLLLLQLMGDDALDELLMYGRRQSLPTPIDLCISRPTASYYMRGVHRQPSCSRQLAM